MPAEPPSPAFPVAFAVLTFVGAAVVAIVVAYLGISGRLGWGIP